LSESTVFVLVIVFASEPSWRSSSNHSSNATQVRSFLHEHEHIVYRDELSSIRLNLDVQLAGDAPS